MVCYMMDKQINKTQKHEGEWAEVLAYCYHHSQVTTNNLNIEATETAQYLKTFRQNQYHIHVPCK